MAFFIAFQAALGVLMDTASPELRDPEYGVKLARLKKLLAAYPGRPLVLALGSSRTLVGFRPEVLSGFRTAAGQIPLAFNFGISGAGPLEELVFLRRLLASGVRPDWLLIEVFPPALKAGDAAPAQAWRLAWNELPLWKRYTAQPAVLYREWARSRLLPCFFNRFWILSSWAPSWRPPGLRENWQCLIQCLGWMAFANPNGVPLDRARFTALAYQACAAGLSDFQIQACPRRALRELLELCRREGIRQVLLLMPEGSNFRGWYPASAWPQVEEVLGRLGREYGIPVVNARTWMPDEAFADGHHLLPDAAATFTRRLGRRVLGPLLQGRPPTVLP